MRQPTAQDAVEAEAAAVVAAAAAAAAAAVCVIRTDIETTSSEGAITTAERRQRV